MEKVINIKIVFVTTDEYENAKQIANMLVSEKLAACCSIIHNVTSIFEWEQSIQERKEFLIIIKTSESKLNELEKRVLELSNDEVPEIISFAVESVYGEYYKWLVASLS